MSLPGAAGGRETRAPAEPEPGVRRFRVFYLQVNGLRSIVPAWRLRDRMQSLKLLNAYGEIERLDEGASVEFNLTLYEQPVNLVATAGVWAIFLEADSGRETPRHTHVRRGVPKRLA